MMVGDFVGDGLNPAQFRPTMLDGWCPPKQTNGGPNWMISAVILEILAIYPLVNKQDPENSQFLMETNLPTPIWQGQTVNLLEGKYMLIMLVNPQLGLICLGGRITAAEPDDCHGFSGYPTRKNGEINQRQGRYSHAPGLTPQMVPNGMWKFPMKNQCFV